jgi:hypothetical protein
LSISYTTFVTIGGSGGYEGGFIRAVQGGSRDVYEESYISTDCMSWWRWGVEEYTQV